MFTLFRRSNRKLNAKSPLELGRLGEAMAIDFLKKNQYRIIAVNYTAPIGHSLSGRQISGEIDIIALDESSEPFILTFIEVKSRSSDKIATPQAAVDRRKQRQIIRTSKVFRRTLGLQNDPFRFDVISVLISHDGESRIELLRDYFSDLDFRKVRWLDLPC